VQDGERVYVANINAVKDYYPIVFSQNNSEHRSLLKRGLLFDQQFKASSVASDYKIGSCANSLCTGYLDFHIYEEFLMEDGHIKNVFHTVDDDTFLRVNRHYDVDLVRVKFFINEVRIYSNKEYIRRFIKRIY